MRNKQNPILLKPSDRDGSSAPNESDGEEALSVSELKALHERLAALRASDALPKKKERKSIRALMAYAACHHGVSDEVIQTLVERQFEFDDIKEMHNSHYDELVHFLENLNVKEILN